MWQYFKNGCLILCILSALISVSCIAGIYNLIIK